MPEKTHDEMTVTTFQVVPEPATKGAQAVLAGAGHPRPIVLKLSNASLPGLAVNLLKAMVAVDRDATIKGLSSFMAEIGAAPAAVAVTPSSSPRAVESSDMGWLLSLAGVLQADGKARGISDPVIASLLTVALGGTVMPALVDQELLRRINDGGLSAGRLASLGLARQAPWSVQLDEDRSIDVDADLELGEVAVFGASSDDSKRIFGMSPLASYRLGIILQAAAYAVVSATGAAETGPVQPSAPEKAPELPALAASSSEDNRTR